MSAILALVMGLPFCADSFHYGPGDPNTLHQSTEEDLLATLPRNDVRKNASKVVRRVSMRVDQIGRSVHSIEEGWPIEGGPGWPKIIRRVSMKVDKDGETKLVWPQKEERKQKVSTMLTSKEKVLSSSTPSSSSSSSMQAPAPELAHPKAPIQLPHNLTEHTNALSSPFATNHTSITQYSILLFDALAFRQGSVVGNVVSILFYGTIMAILVGAFCKFITGGLSEHRSPQGRQHVHIRAQRAGSKQSTAGDNDQNQSQAQSQRVNQARRAMLSGLFAAGTSGRSRSKGDSQGVGGRAAPEKFQSSQPFSNETSTTKTWKLNKHSADPRVTMVVSALAKQNTEEYYRYNVSDSLVDNLRAQGIKVNVERLKQEIVNGDCRLLLVPTGTAASSSESDRELVRVVRTVRVVIKGRTVDGMRTLIEHDSSKEADVDKFPTARVSLNGFERDNVWVAILQDVLGLPGDWLMQFLTLHSCADSVVKISNELPGLPTWCIVEDACVQVNESSDGSELKLLGLPAGRNFRGVGKHRDRIWVWADLDKPAAERADTADAASTKDNESTTSRASKGTRPSPSIRIEGSHRRFVDSQVSAESSSVKDRPTNARGSVPSPPAALEQPQTGARPRSSTASSASRPPFTKEISDTSLGTTPSSDLADKVSINTGDGASAKEKSMRATLSLPQNPPSKRVKAVSPVPRTSTKDSLVSNATSGSSASRGRSAGRSGATNADSEGDSPAPKEYRRKSK
jgi:hypothetical protein